MAFEIANGAGSGEYGENFKPADYRSAFLILFEPKQLRTGIKTPYGWADFLDCDFTVFFSIDELKTGTPSKVIKNGSVSGNLGKNLSEYVNRATVGKIGQKDTGKGNPAWIIEQVDQDAIPFVMEYVEKREAEREAQKEGLPDFLKG